MEPRRTHTRTSLAVLLCAALAATGAAQSIAHGRDDRVVTPAWLAQHLRDPDLVVLQVGERKTYDAGHLPGARFVDVASDLAGTDAGGRGLSLEMLPPALLHDRLAALGLSDTSRVVVVESDDWWSASTRAVFTLDYAGFLRVAWLDGGVAAWQAAGLPTSTETPAVVPATLRPLTLRPIVVDADFVRAHQGTPGFALVDARAASFYDGTQAGGPRSGPKVAGHIPGALSAPFSEFVGAGTRLKSPAEIEAAFDRAGVKPGDTVIGYCHIGQQATAMLFAARTLGHSVLLYDGSFEDWVLRGLPVENPTAAKDR